MSSGLLAWSPVLIGKDITADIRHLVVTYNVNRIYLFCFVCTVILASPIQVVA